MAYVKKNIVTEGLSGTIGNQLVFRQRGSKTIVAQKPNKTNYPPSERQKQQQNKFRAANRYAKQAMQDPSLKAAYAEKADDLQSPFNVAMGDYLNMPNITEMELGTYTGTKGHAIAITVVDDYLVADVQVALYNKAGNLLEEGPATLDDNGLDWVYTTQKANGQPKGSRLVIRASDLPGNISEKEAQLA